MHLIIFWNQTHSRSSGSELLLPKAVRELSWKFRSLCTLSVVQAVPLAWPWWPTRRNRFRNTRQLFWLLPGQQNEWWVKQLRKEFTVVHFVWNSLKWNNLHIMLPSENTTQLLKGGEVDLMWKPSLAGFITHRCFDFMTWWRLAMTRRDPGTEHRTGLWC